MALEIYARGHLFVDGILVANCQGVSIDYDTQDQDIETMELGFAGVSVGAFKTAITIDTATPRTGYDVDFIANLIDRKVCELVYFAGSQKRTVEAILKTMSEKSGTNQASVANITARGGEPKVD